MKTSTRFVSALAAVSCLFHRASAEQPVICTLNPNVTDSNYFDFNSIIVSSQEDLISALFDCDVVEGNVVISNDYSGPLELAVSSFNGSILQHDSAGTPNITTIFLPFATYISSINLKNVPVLEFLYLPEVTQISSLVVSGNSSTKVICESLVNADIINLDVSSLNINFSQLAQVDQSLYINADITTADGSLDFPSLMNASSVVLVGNMSSLSLPKLAVASIDDTDVDLYEDFGLQVISVGTAINVDLPSLYNASGVSIAGYIQEISFPLLLTLNGLLSIEGYSTTIVSLDTLQSVMAISIEGAIQEVSMPAIQDIQAWYVINSSLSLDCSIPEQQWAATNSSYVAGIPSDGSEHYFMCTAFGLKPKHHLSTGAKVGIAVAVIILFAVLLILALQLYKKRRAKKNSQLAIPLSEHELDQRMSSSGGRPPPYAESIASDIGPLVEPKSGV